MTEKQKLLNDYLKNSREAEEILKAKGFLYVDESFIWQTLQTELDCTDIPTELIFKKLSVSQIATIVSRFIELYEQPICEIKLEKSVLPDIFSDTLIKAYLKLKGEKWVVYKYDKDPFPSNPHAHNYNSNIKLHLGNGKLFKGKIECGHIEIKNLIKIRQLIQQRIKNIQLPELNK